MGVSSPDTIHRGVATMENKGRIEDIRRLGRSDLEVTSVGLGVWQWGDTSFWTFGKDFDRKDIDQVWWRNLEAGVNFIDTAEIYGKGASERIVGELLRRIPSRRSGRPWRAASSAWVSTSSTSIRCTGGRPRCPSPASWRSWTPSSGKAWSGTSA
jgi:hypothetical protein